MLPFTDPDRLREVYRKKALLAYGGLLLPYRPMLIRHRGLNEMQHSIDVWHKLYRLVHRVELDRVA